MFNENRAAPIGGDLHELGVAEAARAIRYREISSATLAAHLLDRATSRADLKAFITIDEAAVLSAAEQADRAVQSGAVAPLLGVPLAVKDSYLTEGLTTTLGTSVLSGFKPARDATAVSSLKEAGAIVFGKNNLVEMSYGLTGFNGHHGQVRNPYDTDRVSGGSSSGAGASVAARLVPAALGGDTVGSIRVPASLCGVVGFKPTPGRWPGAGVAPISETLDTIGLLARNVEDCELLDALLTKMPSDPSAVPSDLRGLRLAHAPAQYLDGVDADVERAFEETLRKLRTAGAELVEVDLGADFHELAARTTWPIFLHETMRDIRAFLAGGRLPVSFEQIHAGLAEPLRSIWSHAVIPSGEGKVTDQAYQAALHSDRTELSRRFASAAFAKADGLLFPTTPCAAPPIDRQWGFEVGGRQVTDLFLSRNTHPSSAAGLPGISFPMAVNTLGLPLGIELDAAAGQDRKLLALAHRVEKVIGRVPGPQGLVRSGP